MRATTRQLLLPLHLWTGLTLGLILMVTSLTGALLVWRNQLQPRLDPQRFVVTPGPTRLAADDLVARARAAHPAGELESVRYYGDPTAPFLVYFTTKDYVHLNPYTGAVLGVRRRYGESFGWIEGLHKFLQLDPAIGEPITGYAAFAFGGIILTGLALWWPATRRALQAGLTLNRRLAGRPWHLNLHKTFGAYASVILLVSVVTGVPISLDWVKHGLYPLTGSARAALPTAPAGTQGFAGFTAVAREVERLYPAAVEIYLPLPKDGVIPAYAIEAGAAHPNARSYAWLQADTARVLRATPYTEAARGLRLYYWMMSLHTGLIGGPVVQLLLMFGALSVPLLAVTGTASYLRRRAGRAAASARVPSATPRPVPGR